MIWFPGLSECLFKRETIPLVKWPWIRRKQAGTSWAYISRQDDFQKAEFVNSVGDMPSYACTRVVQGSYWSTPQTGSQSNPGGHSLATLIISLVVRDREGGLLLVTHFGSCIRNGNLAHTTPAI